MWHDETAKWEKKKRAVREGKVYDFALFKKKYIIFYFEYSKFHFLWSSWPLSKSARYLADVRRRVVALQPPNCDHIWRGVDLPVHFLLYWQPWTSRHWMRYFEILQPYLFCLFVCLFLGEYWREGDISGEMRSPLFFLSTLLHYSRWYLERIEKSLLRFISKDGEKLRRTKIWEVCYLEI